MTLGPRAATSCWRRSGRPTITNDGVSIAKEIELEDPNEKIGAELVKEVAKKTDDVAGDGTTTATVLAQALVREGLRNVAAGANPLGLKRGIEKAVQAITESLLKSAKAIGTKDQIAATAGISAGDQTIGDLIAEAMDKVGNEGVITVEESNTFGLQLELTEGMRSTRATSRLLRDRRRASWKPSWRTPSRWSLEDLDRQGSAALLEKVIQSGKPLLIIAEDVDGEASPPWWSTRSAAPSSPSPSRPRASVIVARRCCRTWPSSPVVRSSAKRSVCRSRPLTSRCWARPARSSSPRTRPPSSRAPVIPTPSPVVSLQIRRGDREQRLRLRPREAAGAPGQAGRRCCGHQGRSCHRGGAQMERKHRIEDAVRNAKAAVEEGIVAGGGVALLQSAPALEALSLSATRPPVPTSCASRSRHR